MKTQSEIEESLARKALLTMDQIAKNALDKKKKAEGWGTVVEKPKKPKKAVKVVENIEEEPSNKTEFEELEELLDETFLNNKLLIEENERLNAIITSDNKLESALLEIRKLANDNKMLKDHIKRLTHEKNDAVNYAKSCKKRLKDLQNDS
jgi:hypothetical protein